jgi:hypothetical protein
MRLALGVAAAAMLLIPLLGRELASGGRTPRPGDLGSTSAQFILGQYREPHVQETKPCFILDRISQ